ncbi:diguanylate cyclase (GGDEF)-like protein [Tepidimonas ignava]|uniref:diguanylate cyclase n=2 Tax=Tepidimonas ignava TaxID=114249 RepID=A0A4R3LHH7_9BURK|nr:diguanylate cyclase (GGDEF)-like protein [Tepidimonas ignava]TSE22857.1 putative diguanylate cyclase YdaM [Tepidimonas ignava]
MPHAAMLDHLEHVARLTHGRDRDVLDATLADVVLATLQARAVVLWEVLPGDEGELLDVRAHARADALPAPMSAAGGSAPAWPRLSERPELVQVLHAEVTTVIGDGRGTRILVPLRTETQRRLVLDVALAGPADAQARRVAEGMGRIYVNVINLLDASERDTLTGLLNRKSFDDTFYKATRSSHEAAAEAQRRVDSGAHHWLGVIDVDHFKSVNDRFGHLIGDEVLLLMARLLRSTFRHDDRLYRFGGEEFVALVRADDAVAAAAAFERLRTAVEGHSFPQVGRVTVSIGYTAVRPFDTPADAFERADRAVYQAKAQGRNRVVCFESDVAPQAGQPLQHAGGDVDLF